MGDMKEFLREIPAVHVLQKEPRFTEIAAKHHLPVSRLTEWMQEEINRLRQQLLANEWNGEEPSASVLSAFLLDALEQRAQVYAGQRLRRVINGTGVILHTNLGRARLSEAAVDAAAKAARHYSNLELNLDDGTRGSRHDIVESLICQATGAEAAMVVNNNAAAVYLILRALAYDREVMVSRGELVEIGGSFRVSSIMEESGARLVEVGTTNKTHLYDYETALGEQTTMALKVHQSNFKIKGFTESVDIRKLVEWAKEHELITYEDLGSGAFYDFRSQGIGDEPVISESIAAGVDLITCSGDKLLGGPQAGIIAGGNLWIDKLKKHQLARVLRADKMTLAALEATLKAYISGHAQEQVPVVHDIVASEQEINERTKRFIDFMATAAPAFHCQAAVDHSQVGGGTMPEVFLPTYGVLLQHEHFTAQALADRLRVCDPPVVTRMKEKQVYIDFRTIADDEIEALISALRQLE